METKIIDKIQELLDDKSFIKSIKQEDGQLYISLQLITEMSPDLAEEIQKRPKQTLDKIKDDLKEKYLLEGNLRLTDIPKSFEMLIRENRSKHLGKLVAFEGVIKQAGEVYTRIAGRQLECKSCGSLYNTVELGEELKKITCQACGKPAKQVGEPEYIDNQTIIIEESADQLESVKQPKRIHVVIEDGLVDPKLEGRAMPGTRVLVVGILKDVELKKNSTKRTRVVDAINLIPLEEEIEVNITPEVEEKLIEASKDPKLFQKFIDSFASSIIGNEDVKRAILLQLVGGGKTKKSDGSMTRDFFHLLLIGSRSTGKSVLLAAAHKMLPRARRANGAGTSAVGITAAALKDENTGQFIIEAGAIPLAHKSLLVLDEMDKTDQTVQLHLHECMESGLITINKASVNQTLNAQTSILAAANPRTSEFNVHDDLVHQINMSRSLLSRFDGIFVMKDVANETKDELIATKILSEHEEEHEANELSPEFMKQYIVYARKLNPKINKEASKLLIDFYVSLRKGSIGKNILQMSTRQLEGMVRIAQAHAKYRLSNIACKQDAEVAIEVMKSWLKQFGVDEETGLFNANKLTEPPKSKQKKFNYILQLFEKANKKKMYCHELESLTDETMLPKDEIWDILKSMKVHGYFFEPSRGLFQLIV